MRNVRFAAWAITQNTYTDFPIVVEPWLNSEIDLVGAQVRLLSGTSPAMHICNSYRPNIMGMAAYDTRIDWVPRSDALLSFPASGAVSPPPHFDLHVEPWSGNLFVLYTTIYSDAVTT